MQVPPFNPPRKGDMVGEYRIVDVLGEGGFGIVYKVERAGLFFALKLFRARALDGWAQREINILRRVKHPNVVGFLGCDRWPMPRYGYLYFVMEFVEGRTLEDWALDENPSARQVARVLLELLLALTAVHAQGVFHRDLKRDNILIRDSDSRPILVDFGVGWLAGEPTVTRDILPPGTCEYRSPEAIRYDRDPAHKGTHYRPDEGDDLWAMAVTLYWLLTDLLPFGTRREGGLNDRILTSAPRAPHELNPRVPEALGILCMRMLSKERSERFADCAEVCRALQALLALAELDGRWDLPLLDPDAPDRAPTVQEPDKAPRDAEALEVLQWNVASPRRGRKAGQKPGPAGEKPRTPVVDAPAPLPAAELPVAEEPAPSPDAFAPPLADEPPSPPDGAVPPPEVVRPVSGGEPLPAVLLQRGLSRLLTARARILLVRPRVANATKSIAQVVLLVAVVALACAAAFIVRPRVAAVPPTAPVPGVAPSAAALLPEGGCPSAPRLGCAPVPNWRFPWKRLKLEGARRHSWPPPPRSPPPCLFASTSLVCRPRSCPRPRFSPRGALQEVAVPRRELRLGPCRLHQPPGARHTRARGLPGRRREDHEAGVGSHLQ